MNTIVTIPIKGRVIVDGMPSKQALKDLMAPTKVRVYRSPDPLEYKIGRVHAWTLVHMLAAQGEVTIHWEVRTGTGTCNRRCWDAKRFVCSCSCGGRKHISHIDWKELGHNWLEATLSPPELMAAS